MCLGRGGHIESKLPAKVNHPTMPRFWRESGKTHGAIIEVESRRSKSIKEKWSSNNHINSWYILLLVEWIRDVSKTSYLYDKSNILT
jgi:hypothetical protein